MDSLGFVRFLICISEKEKQSFQPPSLTATLPHDLVLNIVARVSRSDYPALSLVSKHFRSLVASPELYARRSLLGCKEHCLYVVLNDAKSNGNRLYILRRKTNGSHGLFPVVPSLPFIPYISSSFVAEGSSIYVFTDVTTLRIDCESHTVQPLPSMPAPFLQSHSVANVIDGRIYVIGCPRGEVNKDKVIVLVFNTETQMWENEMKTFEIEAGEFYHGSVVISGDKMYTKGFANSYFYEPKERKWETDGVLNSQGWWFSCVVDDVLYYYECCKKELRAYDSKKRCWLVVKGLEALSVETASSLWSQTESYCGKLALFFHKGKIGRRSELWCAEISLERSQGGEIWGKVEWCNHLLTGMKFLYTKSLDVVV
ncbi:unnamed protein product [Eruca vesicaria subsp. sativa]|uniref:F-box domain-containing protein n=1 Tax=Eruca vesicaria subsp. sativa TaxID=29727 RepID=A0ABC8IMK1_ERUVS|nr:unnamed protein product [Eruca vesicaria subsp. sativa]